MSKNNNNGSYDKPPYEVGYGKPPKHTQFKPGMSGNKAGRPENTKKYLSEMIEKAFYSHQTMCFNSKTVSKITMDIMLKKVSELAMKGDMKAARLMCDLSEKYRITVQDIEFIPPYIPSRTQMREADPDFNDDNL